MRQGCEVLGTPAAATPRLLRPCLSLHSLSRRMLLLLAGCVSTCSALKDSVRPFSLQNCSMTLMTLHVGVSGSSKVATTDTAAKARVRNEVCGCRHTTTPACPARSQQHALPHSLSGLNLQRHAGGLLSV